MFDNIKADFHRIYWNYPSKEPANPFKKLRAAIDSQGFQALLAYRLHRWSIKPSAWPGMTLAKRPFSLFAYIMRNIVVKMYDIKICKDAVIGKSFCIHHFGGIYIGFCKIGENCTISQQAKITAEVEGDGEFSVILEDLVWVGGHSRIAGTVHVGQGATIAAGSIITDTNIAANHLVAGKTGRILNKNYNNLRLHNLPDFKDDDDMMDGPY